MRVTGAIMECNPFHEGHAWFLKKAREETGCDYLVSVMSGSYVQRGEPAVFDKSVRARALLEGGADLVLEIPLVCACSAGPVFAEGAVRLLALLGLPDTLCFGSEAGDTDQVLAWGRDLAESEKDPAFHQAFRSFLQQGLSFPAARQRAMEALGRSVPLTPNDLLAAEYCRVLACEGLPLRPLAIPRTRAESATSLRERLRDGVLSPDTYPASVRRQAGFDSDPPSCVLSPDDFSGQLLQALLSGRDLSAFLDVSGDLSARIRRLLPEYVSFSSFSDLVKTRNLTRTRVMRSLLHILLGIREEDHRALKEAGYIGYARVLGFQREAAPLLKALSETSSIPLLTKLAGAPETLPPLFREDLERSIRADFLYTRTAAMAAAGKGLRTASLPRTEYERKLVIL